MNKPAAGATSPSIAIAAASPSPVATTTAPALPTTAPAVVPASPVLAAASRAATPAATPSNSPAPVVAAPMPTAVFSGPADGAVLGKRAAASLVVSVRGVTADRVHGTIDGAPINFGTAGSAASHRAGGLADGAHSLEVKVDGATGDAHVVRTFTVDTKPPALAVTSRVAAASEPLVISGTTDAGATVMANGLPVAVTAGSWKAEFITAPAAVQIVASDEAGNSSSKNVSTRTPMPVTRAVHMTARAWGYKPKRDAAMALLRQRKINAIQVDIKDEDGLVGYATKVQLAATAGAVEPHYDVKKMVAEIHGAGGRVIGRLVAFRDPALTKWAWTTGRRDMVLQKTNGTPYTGSYGDFAFPNFAHPTVQKYNVDLAVEAAKLGFDDVLYDYIRRPDGKLAEMRIPGLRGTPEQSVADTVVATKAGFDAAGVATYLGVSVFGIAATRPREIAQDVALMAPVVDYVAPMVYPSHWAPGEYDVADPNSQPYEIVQRSLKDFQTAVRGTSAAVVPWLQDFSLGVKYGPDQVRAQIKASADDGIQSFLLWNASANYQGAALAVME